MNESIHILLVGDLISVFFTSGYLVYHLMVCQALWKALHNLIWFWLINCVNPILRGSPLLPSQLPGEHTVVLPHMVHSTFRPFTIMTSFLPYTGRVRNPVVGHELDGPQLVFNVHQSHRHNTTNPSLFTRSGTTCRHAWSSQNLA